VITKHTPRVLRTALKPGRLKVPKGKPKLGRLKVPKARQGFESKYFLLKGKEVKPRPGSRPNNQSSPKVQRKLAEREGLSIVSVPKHRQKFIKEVKQKGKADLSGLCLDVCHITPVDKMKETMALVLSKPDLTVKQKRMFEDAMEDTISSDDEDGKKKQVKRAKKIHDPKTNRKDAMRFADDGLDRLNQTSRNLRLDHTRTNRVISNSLDQHVNNGMEDERSGGISDKWDELNRSLGGEGNNPKSKVVKGRTLVQSSSVSPNPQKSFTEIKGRTKFYPPS
jgi:hypothetical protein